MRPSQFQSGGGIEGTIVDAVWTDEFNGEPYKAGKKITDSKTGKKIEADHALFLYVTIRVDGADEDTSRTLRGAKNYEIYEVSEDGHTLKMADEGPVKFSDQSGAGKFLASFTDTKLTTNPADEDLFDEDPNSLDVSPIIGMRARFHNRVDEERTKKYGEKVSKKDGKSYKRSDFVVAEVLGESEEAPAKTSKAAVNGKPNGKAKEPSVAELTKETLISLVQDAGGSLAKSKLSMAVVKKLTKHPQREDVRKLIFTDKFLEQQDGWTYNKASKNQTIEVEAEE